MQMHGVDTKVGTTIWLAACDDRLGQVRRRLALSRFLEVPVDVLDHHGGVVDEDADREGEAA